MYQVKVLSAHYRQPICGSAERPGTTQAHLWNALPPDVIKFVLKKLPFQDAWTCRTLSSCWALAVRTSVPVEVVIPVEPQNLGAKVRRLQQTVSLPGPRSYTFKLEGLLSVPDCNSLLDSLTVQVSSCTL